jgi:hypothetical protein
MLVANLQRVVEAKPVLSHVVGPDPLGGDVREESCKRLREVAAACAEYAKDSFLSLLDRFPER